VRGEALLAEVLPEEVEQDQLRPRRLVDLDAEPTRVLILLLRIIIGIIIIIRARRIAFEEVFDPVNGGDLTGNRFYYLQCNSITLDFFF
jgi:hypothetical protein